MKSLALLGVTFLVSLFSRATPLTLWYDCPATTWMSEALPLGNGMMGAMWFGGTDTERIQINEKTLWTGSTTKRGAYQNFADLYITMRTEGAVSHYRRELSLDNAVGRVSYEQDGVSHEREYLLSNPDQVLAVRLATPGSTGKLSFALKLKDAHSGTMTVGSEGTITIGGRLDVVSYAAKVQVKTKGGSIKPTVDELLVEDADEATLLLSAATDYDIHSFNYINYKGLSPLQKVSNAVSQAATQSFHQLKERHVADHKQFFDRTTLDLDVAEPAMPTDLLVRQHNDSRYLDLLYFQYGRYLLIASSRGIDLPNNLQGVWNDSNYPAWQCDIHSNINIQMNYWPAEVASLSELHLPFINYVMRESQRSGTWQALAQKIGCRGWMINTQANIFGHTDWNANRPANAWYCMHLFDHYAYTQDLDFRQARRRSGHWRLGTAAQVEDTKGNKGRRAPPPLQSHGALPWQPYLSA